MSKRRSHSPARRASSKSALADTKQPQNTAPYRCEQPFSDAIECNPAESQSTNDQLIAGYLNLVADVAHNFTDGLMLGAAFVTSWEVGVSATIACLAHEVPHEVGDVVVLMQAGFRKWDAIRAQLSTAIGALLGTCISLATGETEATMLLAFTAGGFIYVAAVDILPCVINAPSTPMEILRQVFALCAGVGVMIAITTLEA